MSLAIFEDEEGNLFEDNDERAIFFAKGVIETIKKLNWIPDIIHVHGWLSYLLPLYMKYYYASEKLFEDTKVVTSVYNQSFKGELSKDLPEKLLFDKIPEEAIEVLKSPCCENLVKIAIQNSDGVVFASETLPKDLTDFIKSTGKPFLPFPSKENYAKSYLDFYKNKIV